MTSPGVDFEGVWKKFHYGVVHDSLRDFLPAVTRRLLGRTPHRDELATNDFWALRDVSFSVRPGEALGIIGPNGSGKSTALKLLSRVLGPTRGRCRVTGRAGTLLELSAGFHPDLTGRENIYLQGAVMGMRRPEIAGTFDRIVDFAGIERFLDTPVKRYSSGMAARLGFAIAAHLDPEVLIIDEVLAVGDASFQRKALGRIQQLVGSGIPVVIVTHQLDQVTALCTKALLLEYGSVVAEGAPPDVVTTYLARSMQQKIGGAAAIAVKSMEVWDGTTTIVSGERARFGLDVVVRDRARVHEHRLSLRVRGVTTGTTVYEAALDTAGGPFPERSEWFWLGASLWFNVAPGPYYVEVVVRERADNREIGSGPGTYVDVVAGRPFDGPVQLNLHCEVTHAEEFPAELGHEAPGDDRLGVAR